MELGLVGAVDEGVKGLSEVSVLLVSGLLAVVD